MSAIPRHVALLIEIAAIAASHKESTDEPGIATLIDRLAEELRVAYTEQNPDIAAITATEREAWASYFDARGAFVGAKADFAAHEIAEILRGPRPFGSTAAALLTGNGAKR